MATSPKPAAKPAPAAPEVSSLRIEDIVALARQVGAESIHLQPTAGGVQVFFRYPGAAGTQAAGKGSQEDYAELLANLKTRVGADPLKMDRPQRGQDLLEIGDDVVLISMLTGPCAWGETLLISLEPEVAEKSLADLGLQDAQAWRAALGGKTGLCLVCGPASAGKTATLRASLFAIDRAARPAVMLADENTPHVPEVWSIAPGMLKAQGLAAFLPVLRAAGVKVLVLDEIGNAATAQAALLAARTCLVLAGVRCEPAVAAGIQCLRDWGLAEADLAATLKTVLVQCLLHATCGACKGSGCTACGDSGLGPKIPVFVNPSIESSAALRQLAQPEGKTPAIVQAAADLCTQGLVPVAEIRKAFGELAVPIHLRAAEGR